MAPATQQTDTTTDDTEPPEPTPSAPAEPANGNDIGLSADGTLVVADGVEVLRTIDNPVGWKPPRHSMGVAYTKNGKEYWALATLDPDGGGLTWEPARKAFDSLELWINDELALNYPRTGATEMQLVRYLDGGRLEPLEGVEILEQRTGVVIPDYTDPAGSTSAALVTYEGKRWWVLAFDGNPPPNTVMSGSVGGKTMDDFIAYTTAQVEGGAGLK